MNPLKYEVKAATAHSMGVLFEDKLEAAKSRAQQCAGAKRALATASNNLGSVMSAIKKEYDDGGMDGIASPDEVLTYVNRQMKRVVGLLDNMALGAESERLISEGKASMAQEAMSIAEQAKASATNALRGIREAEARGESTEPPSPAEVKADLKKRARPAAKRKRSPAARRQRAS